MSFLRLTVRFSSWLIMAQLVLAPWQGVSLVGLAEAGECTSGLQWNEMLGRCLSTEQAAKIQAAAAECEKKSTASEKKQCYLAVIDGKMKDAEASGEISEAGKIDSNKMSLILAMGGLAASLFFIMGNKGKCQSAMSAWLMAGGSVAVVAGEILSANQYKKKMKEAQDAMKKISDSSKSEKSDNATATNYQEEAFNVMIKKEEAVISAGKFKKNLYMVATAAYAASAVMAGMEMFRQSSGTGDPGLNCNGEANQSNATPHGGQAPAAPANPNPPPSSALARRIMGPDTSVEAPESGLLISFLDNHFTHGQRIPFHMYQDNFHLEQAQTLDQWQGLQAERVAVTQGSNQSIGLDTYETILKLTNEVVPEKEKPGILELSKWAFKSASEFVMPSAHAEVTALAGATGSPGQTLSMGGKLSKLFKSPMTRLVLAGILTANSFFMMGKISKEIKKAEERKKFLEKLREQVIAAGVAYSCADADRTDPSKAECYCYNADGGVNPARSASQVCQALFSDKGNLAATTYGTSGSATSSLNACVASNGAYDGSCSCKSKGTCLTIGTGFNGSGAGGISLGSLPSTINGLNSGTISGTNIDSAAMGTMAANYNRIKDQLAAKNPSLKAANLKAEKQGKQVMAALRQELASSPALASAGSSSAMDNDASFMKATTPAEALERIRQDINSVNAMGAANSGRRGGQSNEGLDLSGIGNAPAGGVTIDESQLAQVMESGLQNGNSDINTNSDTNIFDILSNRYQRSGMPRLFGGEAVVPADQPAEKQIND